ncbi:MAG: ribose ABC transporter permease [Pseudonocardiales bacterium]|nr:MAG: ribose ABC transporter permease [Pseudonocardiales bacterium]
MTEQSKPRPGVHSPRQSTATRLVRQATGGTRFLVVLILLISVFSFFSLSQPRFFTHSNVEALLTSASILWVVSIGLTFVMLTGGFDLSLGSLLALSGVVFGLCNLDLHLPAALSIPVTVVVGACLGGLVNGVLIGRLGLSFLIVTLGTLTLYRGLVNLITNTKTRGISSSLLDRIAFSHLAGLPIPVWIMAATFVVALWILSGTYFGRDVYAVGGNHVAARLSGVRVPSTIVAVYAIAGALAALGGVLETARVGAVSPGIGQTIIFDATAAVLLGGTSFAGGVGGVGGTAVAVIFLATLQNGLAVAGVQSFWQQVITGAILIVAVLIEWAQRGDSPLRRHRPDPDTHPTPLIRGPGRL